MHWLVLVWAYILLKSAGSVFRRKLLGRENAADPNVTAVFFNICAGALLWVYVALFHPFVPFDVVLLWVWILINVCAAVLGDILQFNAMKHIGVGDFALVDSSRAIWTVVGATLLLAEPLSFAQIFGGLLIIFANVLVFWPQRSGKVSWYGLSLAFGFAAVFGLATVNDRILFPEVDVISYLAVAFLVQGGVLALLYRSRMKKSVELLRVRNSAPFLGDVLFFVPSIVILMEAVVRTDNLSVLSAWLPMTVIVSVVLGMLFLNERSFLGHKLVAAVMATCGAVMLVFS
jgi:uncharacterized membrane protein